MLGISGKLFSKKISHDMFTNTQTNQSIRIESVPTTALFCFFFQPGLCLDEVDKQQQQQTTTTTVSRIIIR
jgi:hypothetical protein